MTTEDYVRFMDLIHEAQREHREYRRKAVYEHDTETYCYQDGQIEGLRLALEIALQMAREAL